MPFFSPLHTVRCSGVMEGLVESFVLWKLNSNIVESLFVLHPGFCSFVCITLCAHFALRGACFILGLTVEKKWVICQRVLHLWSPREARGFHLCVHVCVSPAAVVGPSETLGLPLDSLDWQHRVPERSSTSFLFSFGLVLTLLHFLGLPPFHALSSHDTVGGAELQYLEFPWAPLSGISLLLECRKMSSATRRISMSTLEYCKYDFCVSAFIFRFFYVCADTLLFSLMVWRLFLRDRGKKKIDIAI